MIFNSKNYHICIFLPLTKKKTHGCIPEMMNNFNFSISTILRQTRFSSTNYTQVDQYGGLIVIMDSDLGLKFVIT